MTTALTPVHVERRIRLLRGERVMLDTDLAELYEVETRALVQAVKRNRERFPADFMFQLTAAEAAILRSQDVTQGPPTAVDATRRTRSPSKASRCSRACCAVSEQCG